MNRLCVLMIFVIAAGTNASLFNRKKMSASSSKSPTSGLQGNQESFKQARDPSVSTGGSLKGHLEDVSNGYNFLIEGIGEILLAVDNIAVEDVMLEEMDDRLVLLYKYYEEDIDQLLTYCKQVTDTAVMHSLKDEGNLDGNEEFVVIETLPVPDENNKGDWSSMQDLLWNNQ